MAAQKRSGSHTECSCYQRKKLFQKLQSVCMPYKLVNYIVCVMLGLPCMWEMCACHKKYISDVSTVHNYV